LRFLTADFAHGEGPWQTRRIHDTCGERKRKLAVLDGSPAHKPVEPPENLAVASLKIDDQPD